MAPNDVGNIIGAVGFPISIFVFIAVFLSGKVWPWYTKRMETNDKIYADRHIAYMEQIKITATAMVNTVNALISLKEEFERGHQEIIRMLEKPARSRK